jgi:hypothetical protein
VDWIKLAEDTLKVVGCYEEEEKFPGCVEEQKFVEQLKDC